LVITDVIMPRMGGKVMAEWLKASFPDLKVIFTSGYTDDAIAQHGVLELPALISCPSLTRPPPWPTKCGHGVWTPNKEQKGILWSNNSHSGKWILRGLVAACLSDRRPHWRTPPTPINRIQALPAIWRT
jgi:hypothetical protein